MNVVHAGIVKLSDGIDTGIEGAVHLAVSIGTGHDVACLQLKVYVPGFAGMFQHPIHVVDIYLAFL